MVQSFSSVMNLKETPEGEFKTAISVYEDLEP
jgi:hypothetical protein